MSVGKAGVLLEIQNGHLGKGKFHTRTGHEGPEVEQRCSCTLSLTSALDRVDGQHDVPAALPPGKTRYPLYRRLGASQGLSGRVRKNLAPIGIRSSNRPARSEKSESVTASSPIGYVFACVCTYLQSLTNGNLVVWGF